MGSYEMNKLAFRSLRIVLPLLAVLWLGYACGGGGGSTNVSMDSHKSSVNAPSVAGNSVDHRERHAVGEIEAGISANSDSLFRTPVEPKEVYGSEPEEQSYTSKMLAQAGVDEARISSWFMPAAYAADHAIDDAYLIRNGDCSLQVPDYNEAAIDVRAIASKYSGYVSDSHSELLKDERRSGYMTMRVPRVSFDDAWADCLGLGKILKEEISTQDVSQTYVASMSRLKNLMAHQATLQSMLEEAIATQKQHGLAEGYKQLIDTQEKLFEVTGQIEATEDRLNALSDQIERSTISVRLSEKFVEIELVAAIEEVQEQFIWGFGETAGNASKDIATKFRGLTQGLLFFIISGWTGLIWPAFWIFVIVLTYRKWLKPYCLKRYGMTPWAVMCTPRKSSEPVTVPEGNAPVDGGSDKGRDEG